VYARQQGNSVLTLTDIDIGLIVYLYGLPPLDVQFFFGMVYMCSGRLKGILPELSRLGDEPLRGSPFTQHDDSASSLTCTDSGTSQHTSQKENQKENIKTVAACWVRTYTSQQK